MKSPYDIIIRPLVTEKSTEGSKKYNTYFFAVDRDANKYEIKRAIETVFSVKVTRINTICLKGKPKRYRAATGKKPDWKKAIVSLKEGDRIDVF